MEQSRRHFYRAANAIFGRIGRIATEKVILHLLSTKCMASYANFIICSGGLSNEKAYLKFSAFHLKFSRTGDISVAKARQS